MPPKSFPSTPIAGCLHLLDASLASRGIPGLSPEQHADLVACRIAAEAFPDAFADVDPAHRDAAFGLYLSHLSGGFSPTNARLCFDLLHEVVAHLDAPLEHHEIVPIADTHRGASILRYHRATITLMARQQPPLAFRLVSQTPGAAEAAIDLDSLQLDDPDAPERIADWISRHGGPALA